MDITFGTFVALYHMRLAKRRMAYTLKRLNLQLDRMEMEEFLKSIGEE